MRGYDLQVHNLSQDNWVVENGWLADTSWKQMVGLLKHRYLNKGEGMWFPGCYWIHSMGMKFEFDAVFLNREKKVVKVVSRVKRNRFLAPVLRAASVVEIPAGGAARCRVKVGDQLEIIRFQK
ncbi:MAG: DUF192 domain-containing protein [Verrucomicrobiota bacterium]